MKCAPETIVGPSCGVNALPTPAPHTPRQAHRGQAQQHPPPASKASRGRFAHCIRRPGCPRASQPSSYKDERLPHVVRRTAERFSTRRHHFDPPNGEPAAATDGQTGGTGTRWPPSVHSIPPTHQRIAPQGQPKARAWQTAHIVTPPSAVSIGSLRAPASDGCSIRTRSPLPPSHLRNCSLSHALPLGPPWRSMPHGLRAAPGASTRLGCLACSSQLLSVHQNHG